MPGGLFPSKSMLEFDTTEKNIFITDLPTEDFSILDQVNKSNGAFFAHFWFPSDKHSSAFDHDSSLESLSHIIYRHG